MLTHPSKSQNSKYSPLDLGLTYTHSSCHDTRANNSNCIILICNSSVITTDNSKHYELKLRKRWHETCRREVDVACSYVHRARFLCIITAWSISLPRRVTVDLSPAVNGCSASLTLEPCWCFYRNYCKWVASPNYYPMLTTHTASTTLRLRLFLL